MLFPTGCNWDLGNNLQRFGLMTMCITTTLLKPSSVKHTFLHVPFSLSMEVDSTQSVDFLLQ